MRIAAGLDRLRPRIDRTNRTGPDHFVPPTVLDRPLTDDEDAALRWILWLEDFPGAQELRAQVSLVRATFGRTTELDLESPTLNLLR